jgi:hypothetical protein
VRITVDPVDAEPHVVDVTPAPAFARLERTDDRMLRGLCVRSRVAVRRVITAADVTASKTDRKCSHLPPMCEQSSQLSTEVGMSVIKI